MGDIVQRLRDARNWLNDGECCGDKDSDGICAAPACIFGEALKELYEAADEIERLREALKPFAHTGKLFPGPPGIVEFDQLIYMPAAGSQYLLSGDDLRRARAALEDKG